VPSRPMRMPALPGTVPAPRAQPPPPVVAATGVPFAGPSWVVGGVVVPLVVVGEAVPMSIEPAPLPPVTVERLGGWHVMTTVPVEVVVVVPVAIPVPVDVAVSVVVGGSGAGAGAPPALVATPVPPLLTVVTADSTHFKPSAQSESAVQFTGLTWQ